MLPLQSTDQRSMITRVKTIAPVVQAIPAAATFSTSTAEETVPWSYPLAST